MATTAAAAGRRTSAACATNGQLGGCNHDHSAEQALFDMPMARKLARMEEFKRDGNAAFQSGDARLAVAAYAEALRLAEYAFPDESSHDFTALEALRGSCLSNCAAAELRLGAWEAAATHATAALAIDGGGAKALFRRAVARRHQQRFGEAKADIAAALKAAPGDAALVAEAALIERGRREEASQRTRLAQAMFSAPAATPSG